MKRLLLFSFCIAFALYSCTNKAAVKPDNPVLADSISATIDGANENFNTIDSAGYLNTASFYSMSITAKNGTSATADKIQLDIFNPTPITVGTYALTPGSYNPPFVPLIIYYTNGGSNLADDYVIDYTGAHQIAITITYISSSKVQGTFSGTLVVAAGTSGTTKTITNGKFDVYIK